MYTRCHGVRLTKVSADAAPSGGASSVVSGGVSSATAGVTEQPTASTQRDTAETQQDAVVERQPDTHTVLTPPKPADVPLASDTYGEDRGSIVR